MSISVYGSNTNESLQFVTASSFDLGNGRLHRFRLRFSYFVVWYFVRLSTNVVHLRFLHCFADFFCFTLRQLYNYNFVFCELLCTHYNFVLNSLFHTTLILYFL